MEHLAKYLHLAGTKGRHIVEYAINNPNLTADQIAADIGETVTKTRYHLTKFRGRASALYERDTAAAASSPAGSPPELAVLLTKLIDRVEDLGAKVEAPFVHTPKTEPTIELNRDVTTEVFWSDLHWHPEHRQGHDPAAYRLALEFLKRRQPDILFFGGDIMDCVTPETKVLTYDLRWVAAGELVGGDELIGFEEEAADRLSDGRKNARRMSKSIVENAGRALQPTYELRFSDGTSVRCSVGHSWLGWKSRKARGVLEWLTTAEIVQRVSEGRPVILNRPVQPWEIPDGYLAGYVAAAYDGEGHLTFDANEQRCGRVGFSQKPNVFLDRVKTALEGFGYDTYLCTYESDPDRTTHALSIKGGFWEMARFVGQFDIPRFKEKWAEQAPVDNYRLLSNAQARAEVAEVVNLGVHEVVTLKTSTRTYIAEGLASHNCYAASRYEKKPRLATPEAYQGEIQYGKERMAEVRRVCPNARFIWLTGNHELRVPRSVHTNAPWLINEIRDVEKALELDSFEVQTVEPGYKIGKLGHYHGHEIAGSGRVNVAKNKFDRYFTNMIFGHHHKFSVWCPRDQEGSYRGAYGNATLHWLSAEYTEYPEWNQGLSEVEYTKSGLFHVNQVLFHKPSVWSSKAEYIYQGEHVSVDLEKTEAMVA